MELKAEAEDLAELFSWRPLVEILSPLAFEHLVVIIMRRMAEDVENKNTA